MSLDASIASIGSRQWTRRSAPWLGGLFIGTIVALSAYNILRSYQATVTTTGRELDSHARVIAEQTARSLQAVDVVLRHIAEKFKDGTLPALSAGDLRAYLKEQAVGLVQIDGLVMFDQTGAVRATSFGDPPPPSAGTARGYDFFEALRTNRDLGLLVANAMESRFDGLWIFPIARRLEMSSGEFAGMIGARGRIDYFQEFYHDVRLDQGTKITLMQQNGTLLARYPPVTTALGKHFPIFDEMLAFRAAHPSEPTRTVSPVDGVDRFGALQLVPDYPLAVIVTRDAEVALGPWREQSIGIAGRTLAFAVLAALLLTILMRQISRLYETRASLETSQERYALAVAGSDDGIWDFDYRANRVFASARARAILGLPPGPETQPMEEWFASLQLHSDDAAQRIAAMEAHLKGEAPTYIGEFRVLHPDGGYRWVRIRGLCVRDATGKPQRMAGSISDVDGAKRAEDALRLSEERYAIAMTGSHEAHWVWDVASDELYASPKLKELFGIPPDAQLPTRTAFFARMPVHEDDRARVQKAMTDHLAGLSPRLDIEYRIVEPATGEIRWIHTRGQCFRDADGKPRRVAGATVEVTERKRAEEALRQSEERFALAVAGSNDGIIDWDIVADRMYTSERTLRIVGVESTSTVHTRAEWLALLKIHPDDQRRHADDLREYLAGHTNVREGEYRVQQPDGEYRWVRVRNLCVRDAAGRPLRLAGSVSDIDAHKRAETALRESEERYQLAVAGSNEGLWDWDLASDMLFVSPRAQEFIGLDPSEPRRPRREWLASSLYHPDDILRVRAALSAHLRGDAKHFVAEYRMRHRSGEWRWYRQRGLALRDANGRPYRMAGSMEDITDSKNAEAERLRLEGKLRQAQKLEAMGTLAGGIAHDFNNILSAILGYGEMVQREVADGTTLRRHIDAAMSAGMRAKALVERILAFSRSGMGERVPVHVESVVAEALDLVASSLPSGVRLERRLEAGDAAVMGDPTQVHQVVMNLCTNAIQAMKSAGVMKVSLELVEMDAATVATSTLSAGSYVRLRVQDTGTGIPANILERIFDPFFTTKDVGVGTGLGLSLVHGIVTDLGGGIDVESRLGEGATFTVYLPWRGRVMAPGRVEESFANGAGETVLLVDDEGPLVQLGEEMIAELGYEPVGFTSSVKALETFRASPERFDVVLSDEAMPEMTGSELAREIHKIRADIPIVLMSGYVTAALSARAREAGVSDVLSKPLVSRVIARSLASALQH